MTPEQAMRLALAQARKGTGRTFPNPSVGAVVYRGDRILGRGYTRPPGGLHAEAVALDAARRRHGARALRGASMAVTLEPCCHTGRTPPCTKAIARAGIRRVFIGCRDGHALVAKRGVRKLRTAGVEVETGILEDACKAQHRGFLSVCERGRPFVTLKLATSLDARIATASGESRWITSEPARAFVHQLRARTDAIAVGSGTALADDPELTARRGSRLVHQPVRIVVDGSLRVPVRSRLYRQKGAPLWVLHRSDARGQKARAEAGAQLLSVKSRAGRLDLADGFEKLARAGLTTVLIEGGGQLAAALLRARLVDEVHWIQAPLLLGGDGRPALGALGIEGLKDALKVDDLRVRRLGRDLHLYGTLTAAR